jgi:predicted dinucleotide-binding enzyme
MTGTAQPVIGIIGCGRMGSALATMFAARGFTTRLASGHGRTATRLAQGLPLSSAGTVEYAALASDLLILAAPLEAICEQIAPRIGPLLDGQVVIDVSNPGFAGGAAAPVPGRPPTSAAERIAAALPTTRLVKALNCIAARTLAHFFDEETMVTVPIAGDDPSAKITVASVLEPLGFDVADAGPLSTSRWLEQLSELLACLASQDSSRDRIGFRLVRFPPPAPVAKPGTVG